MEGKKLKMPAPCGSAWGGKNNFKSKLYRSMMSFFPVAENRRGECANCGACCQLPVKCFFLRFNSEGKSYCALRRKIGFNFLQCRKYPRTEKEWLTPGKCGYRFAPTPNNHCAEGADRNK